MSHIFDYRKSYIKDNDLKSMYISTTKKFVEYIEKQGKGDRIIEITHNDIKLWIEAENKDGNVRTVSTLDTHLNAIKSFYNYLQKQGKATNIFNNIIDYDEFKSDIISKLKLTPKKSRGYLEQDVVINLLEHLESGRSKIDEKDMMNIYIRLGLLIPVKREVMANLKLEDFGEDFRYVSINGMKIKLPSALSRDMRLMLGELNLDASKDTLIFEYLYNKNEYSNGVFNRPMYLILEEIGYELDKTFKKGSESFSVETLRNTALLEMLKNYIDIRLIAKISDINVKTIYDKIKEFGLEDSHNKIQNTEMLVNKAMYEYSYYEYI